MEELISCLWVACLENLEHDLIEECIKVKHWVWNWLQCQQPGAPLAVQFGREDVWLLAAFAVWLLLAFVRAMGVVVGLLHVLLEVQLVCQAKMLELFLEQLLGFEGKG